MKTSFLFRGAFAAAVAGFLIATPGALPAQPTPAVVSAQPGQRGGVTAPAPESDGLHLSLDRGDPARPGEQPGSERLRQRGGGVAVLPLSEHRNLRSASDEHRRRGGTRTRRTSSAARRRGGAPERSWDAGIGLSQLTPWGGVVDFGLSGVVQHDEHHVRRRQPGHHRGPVLRHHPAASAQLRQARHRDQHR